MLGRLILSSLESGVVMQVTHIVGWQGTGKSTLAALMVAPLEARGAVCAVVDGEAMALEYKGDPAAAMAAHAHVDHLFLEYLPQTFRRATPGDKVIHVAWWPERAAAEPVAQGVANA